MNYNDNDSSPLEAVFLMVFVSGFFIGFLIGVAVMIFAS